MDGESDVPADAYFADGDLTEGIGYTWRGLPGAFTFKPACAADVAGYEYQFGTDYPRYVAAKRVGGPATVQFTPQQSGPTGVPVQSVDRAGNRSPSTAYSFVVAVTAASPGVIGG